MIVGPLATLDSWLDGSTMDFRSPRQGEIVERDRQIPRRGETVGRMSRQAPHHQTAKIERH
jgi:hypothetical protein